MGKERSISTEVDVVAVAMGEKYVVRGGVCTTRFSLFSCLSDGVTL